MRINNSYQYESFFVEIDQRNHPIAWENKIVSLMTSGLTRDEAQIEMEKNSTIEMEMYYDVNAGLFMVESEAADAGTIYNPYSGVLLEDEEDEY